MQGEASAECYQPSARLRLFLVLHEVAAYWQRLGYLYPPPASLFSIWWWILNPLAIIPSSGDKNPPRETSAVFVVSGLLQLTSWKISDWSRRGDMKIRP